MQARRHQRPSPFARVLAATDFSPGAAAAVERAARLPLARDGVIFVIHVMPGDLPAKLRGQAETEARRRLDDAAAAATLAAERAGNSSFEVKPVLVRGRGYVEIIRQARACEVELIAVGRHSRRPFRDLFVGSTAERVVRMSGLPVLVVNTKPTRRYRRPLAALELTDMARRVVDTMLRLIDPETRLCWLVHGYHVPFEARMSFALSRPELARYRKEWRDQAAAKFHRLASELDASGIRWKKVLRSGGPESVIVNEAVRRRADLVAVGTHGRSGLAHALLGSVAAWVLRNVPCDVVVARPIRFTFELP